MDRLKQVNDKNISFEDKKKLMIDFLLNKNIKWIINFIIPLILLHQ